MSEGGEVYKPRLRNDLRIVRMGSEAVVHDTRSRQVHMLNASACFILELCDGESTAATICAELRGTFSNVPDGQLEVHVNDTIDKLRNLGILEE